MTLLRPEFLAFGLLAIVIALAYLRIIPTPKQVVGSLDLWQMALARRPWWYGLQRPLSLALLLAIIGLLTFAIAEPVWLAPKQTPRRIVLVVDTSASMSAKQGESTRLEGAKAAAGKWIDALSPNDRMAIVAAGGGVRIACDFTANSERLKKALAAIKPSDSPDAAAEAIAMFGESANDDDAPTQVILFTDGVFPDYDRLAAQTGEKLRISLLGARVDNSGYTHIAARPSPSDNESYEVLLNVTASPSRSSGSLGTAVTLNGKEINQVPLSQSNPPGSFIRFRVAAPQGGELQAQFKSDDPLPSDNSANLTLAPRQPVQVFLQAGVHPSIRQTLEGMPGVKVEPGEGVPEKLHASSVAVLQGAMPKTLPAAHVLAIGPASDTLDWKLGEAQEPPPLVQVAGPAPFGESLNLADLVVERATELELTSPMQVVASAGKIPILATRETPSRRLVLLNLDLDKSDLTLRSGWRPMIRDMITWLGGRSERIIKAQTIAEPFRFSPATAERTLEGPDGITRKIAPQATTSPPPERVGPWKLSGGGSEETFHVMLGLANESRLAGPEKGEEMAPPPRVDAVRDFHLAPWLILAAGLLVVVEWGLFHRRLTI